MQTQFKLIGFDLDGTLINSLPDIALSINQTLKHYELPEADEELVAKWIGNGSDQLMQRSLDWAYTKANKTLTKEQEVEAKKYFKKRYAANTTNLSKLYDNVKSTLEQLKSKGYKLAIVTNKPADFVPHIVEYFDLTGLFDELIGDGSLAAKKPHPGPLYYLCGKYGLYPKQVLFVGDSKNDIQAAHSAGCPVVGLTYGYNYGVPIKESQPDWVFDEFAQLLEIL